VAASWLCHRHLKTDLTVTMIAGLTPDVIDKVLYHGLAVVPGSRVPMHTLIAWVASTALVVALALVVAILQRAERPSDVLRGAPQASPTRWRDRPAWRWGAAWTVGYGAHLLCDSPLVGSKLPFLYPFCQYSFRNPSMPLGFLFGLDRWPVQTLIMEALLVTATLYLEWRRWRARKSGAQLGRMVAY
jgi:hypothetical protein